MIDRVLRRDHKERIGKFVRRSADGNFALLHRLKERGLRLRRGSVDFVRKENIREDGPLHKTKTSLTLRVFLKDVCPRDVRRGKIRGELNASEIDVENLRDRRDGKGLREPRHALEKTVPASKDRRKDLANRVFLSDDDFGEFVLQSRASLAKLLQQRAEILPLILRRKLGDPRLALTLLLRSFRRHPHSLLFNHRSRNSRIEASVSFGESSRR